MMCGMPPSVSVCLSMMLQIMPNYVRPVIDPNFLVTPMCQLHLQASGQNPAPVLTGQTGGTLPAE